MIIKLAILLAILLIVTGFAAWAFLPARHLPGNQTEGDEQGGALRHVAQ